MSRLRSSGVSSREIEIFGMLLLENTRFSSKPKNPDLEYDLRTSDFIAEKCNNSEEYCKDLYASLSNVLWIKYEVISLLKEDYWHCSFRHAGGIVADILEKGDYLDWYCSKGEGYVTEEIANDLFSLGWKFKYYEPNDLI